MTNATAPAPRYDLIDRIAGLAEGSAIHALRHQRDKVVATAQQSHDAFFGPQASGITIALSPTRRLLVALYACRLTPSPTLAAHYLAQLAATGADPALVRMVDSANAADIDRLADRQLAAMLAYTRILTTRPIEGDRDALQTLPAAGLGTPEIVLLSQLVSFLSYQTRLAAGLRAMDAPGAPEAAEPATPDHPMLSNDALRVASAVEANGFTNRMLMWRAWLDVVQIDSATPEQIAVLEASHQSAKTADYYLTLAHCPDILGTRSAAFNAVMYAPRGLSRAERELSAVAASRVNGCVYCCSVHARFFEQLAKRNDVIAQLFDDPATAGTSARERALIAFAIELTLTPEQVDAASMARLRDAGFTPLEIIDAVHATAMFGWANRLMLNLGEPFEAEMAAAA